MPERRVDRAVENDRCWLVEKGQGLLDGEIRPFEVSSQHLIKRRFIHLFQGCPFVNARVDKQDIQLAKRFVGTSHQPVNLIELRDIRLNCQHIVTEFSSDRFKGLTITSCNHDSGSMGMKCSGRCQANPTIAAGHDSNFSLKRTHHNTLLLSMGDHTRADLDRHGHVDGSLSCRCLASRVFRAGWS
jgi:hypothetical protein